MENRSRPAHPAHATHPSWPLAAALVLLASAGPAEAASYSFSAQSLIIPMDICSQPSSGSGGTPARNYCPEAVGTADDGMIKAYGLVYRLVQNGINVYYVVNSTKASIDAVDLTITAPSGTPVALYDRSVAGGGAKEFMKAGHTSLAYRGAPFVIDATDYAKVVAFLAADSAGPRTFVNVDIHVAKQGFMAPVSAMLNTVPPRIALLNIGGAAIGVLEGYLKDAGLYTGTAVATYPSIGDVFTEFDNVSDFTTSNGLAAGNFQILWAPHWDGSTMSQTDVNAVMAAIAAFVDAGHSFFAECAAIATIEGVDWGPQWWPSPPSVPGNLMTTGAGNAGVTINALPQPWPTQKSEGITVNPAFLGNPLVQIGDAVYAQNASSAVFDFLPDSSASISYRSGVSRLMWSKAPANESYYANQDIFTVFHKDNDPKKGLIIYLGGHSYSSQGSACGNGSCQTFSQTAMTAGERMVLNTMVFLGQAVSNVELARSSPVLLPDNTSYQGTYVQQTVASTSYPPWQGHFREYPPYTTSGTGTAFNNLKANWDAAKGIPAAGSRTVFTAVNVSGSMAQVAFTAANANTLSTPMGLAGTALTNAISGILGGGLGGIDHSTPAIIGPSSVAGSPTRPTVAYVGALDGMLHAIGVSGGGVTPGTELWAFIPPSQLTRIAQLQAGVDGSPQVSDAFVDLSGNGLRSWHTLLAIPSGNFGGTLDMLDVTDPLHPAYLWTAANTSGNYAMGSASGASFTTVGTGAGLRTLVLFATNDAGSAGNGANVYALDAANGSLVWQWNQLYARHIPGTSTLVPNDVPGVPTATDTAGDGSVADKVYFGDLDGRIWELSASTGGGANILYDAGADGYPFAASVALFRDGTTNDLGVVGATSGADWVPSTVTSFVVSIDVQHYISGATGLATVFWKTALTAGERVYAAPTVVGSDVYVFTSFGNLRGNMGTSLADLGNIRRLALGTGSVTLTASVGKGASDITIGSDGSIVAASVNGADILQNVGRNASGIALDTRVRPATVSAWLDLH